MQTEPRRQQAALSSVWPDPAPLRSSTPAVPPLDLNTLPKLLRPVVTDIAERKSVAPDMAACFAILALAGCVNRRAYIEPDVTGWRVVPCLWGGVVGLPGELKTPTLNEVCKPLQEIEQLWFEQYEPAHEHYVKAEKLYKLKERAHEAQYVAWVKNPSKGEEPVLRDESPTKPVCKRLIVTDVTPEALHLRFSENPGGLLLLHDELASWFASLDKPGYETARSFFLKCWSVSGDTEAQVDRVGRGSVKAKVCLSVIGNIQPDALRAYLGNAQYNDGLLQRLQLLVWPQTAPYKPVNRPPNHVALLQYAHACENLLSLDPEVPKAFTFAPAAQHTFNLWRGDLEAKVRDADLPEAYSTHLSKYRSLTPALALLFELADRKKTSTNHQVSLEHTQQAIRYAAYLEDHARKVYWHMTPRSGVDLAAHELGQKVRKGKLGTAFTVRQVYRNDWSGLKNVANVKAACDELVEASWLKAVADLTPVESLSYRELFEASVRKQKIDYLVNPKVIEAKGTV